MCSKGNGKVVPVLFLTEHHAMEVYWGRGIIASCILHGDEWSASCLGCFTPRERAPGTQWIGGGPQRWSGCSGEEKILTTKITKYSFIFLLLLYTKYYESSMPCT
jgi:hypothetical protein